MPIWFAADESRPLLCFAGRDQEALPLFEVAAERGDPSGAYNASIIADELGDAMNQMGGLPGLPGTGAKLPPGFQNFMNVKKK